MYNIFNIFFSIPKCETAIKAYGTTSNQPPMKLLVASDSQNTGDVILRPVRTAPLQSPATILSLYSSHRYFLLQRKPKSQRTTDF